MGRLRRIKKKISFRGKIYIFESLTKNNMKKISSPPKRESLEEILKTGWQHRNVKLGYFLTVVMGLTAGVLYLQKDYFGANYIGRLGKITLLVSMGSHYLHGISRRENNPFY